MGPMGAACRLAAAPSGITKRGVPAFVTVVFLSALLNIRVDEKQSSYLKMAMTMRIMLYFNPFYRRE